jgi:hypothetical protein
LTLRFGTRYDGSLRAWLVLILLMAVTATAFAQPSEGERRFAIGEDHYQAGRYDQALVELEAAQAADPQPKYLWAIAQVYRLKGDCGHAITAYGAYLRTGPSPAATMRTQAFIDQCAATIVPAPAALPAPQPAGPPAEPLIIREVQRVHTRDVTLPWYRDAWGDALVGGGVACLVGGAIGFAVASNHDTAATHAPDYQTVDREVRARDRAQTIGGVTLAAGGALVLGGLLRYALRPKRVRTEVQIDPAAKTAGFSLAWSLE